MCTACFDIKELRILLTHCVGLFSMIIKINRDYSPKQRSSIGLHTGHGFCVVWGGNWTCKYIYIYIYIHLLFYTSRGAQIFQKYTSHPKITGARKVTWGKLNTQDPQILGNAIQYLGAWATRRLGFVRPWMVVFKILRYDTIIATALC